MRAVSGNLPQSSHQTGLGGRLVAIDVLRGLAALAVVLTHIPRAPSAGIDQRFLLGLPLDFGVLGVPMFIVISGFCIHLGYAKRLASGQEGGWSWGGFWKRRFARLYPTYVIALLFSLAVAFGLRTWTGHGPDMPASRTWDLLMHLLMAHNLTMEFPGGLGNPVFWTLGLEEQLYALFAIVVLLRARMSAVKVLGIACSVSVLWRLIYVWTPFLTGAPDSLAFDVGPFSVGYWAGWPTAWWFLWILGAVAAEWHVGLVQVPRWVTSAWFLLGTSAVTAVTHWRTLGRYTKFWMVDVQGWIRPALESVVELSEPLFALACFGLLLRLIQSEQRGGLTSSVSRALAGLGLFSYSLYLTHVPTITVLDAIFGTPASALGTIAHLVGYASASVALAGAFFWAFERPFLNVSRPVATVSTPSADVAPVVVHAKSA